MFSQFAANWLWNTDISHVKLDILREQIVRMLCNVYVCASLTNERFYWFENAHVFLLPVQCIGLISTEMLHTSFYILLFTFLTPIMRTTCFASWEISHPFR